MEKLNIAEILKDCPKGMELDCTMYENVEFDYIDRSSEARYPIHCLMKTNDGYNTMVFTNNGCNDRHPNAKCVIFPKGKTTWEGFRRPYKDGDILIGKSGEPFIFKRLNNNGGCYSYCGIDSARQFKLESDDWTFANSLRFATEEEKQKLFDAIKANVYRWNAETKTLEKLVEPKFKVGDRVKKNKDYISGIVTDIFDDSFKVTYKGGSCSYVQFHYQHEWELVPNKFDITTLKPFESRVLVRGSNDDIWKPAIWGIYNDIYCSAYPYITTYGATRQCIPYEDNQHLLGTTNDCDDFYKTWE